MKEELNGRDVLCAVYCLVLRSSDVYYEDTHVEDARSRTILCSYCEMKDLDIARRDR